jgi:hypothetical protein
MTNEDFLQGINDALRGTDDDAPTIGTDEANYWLRTASRLRRNLYKNAANLQLSSAFEVLELGTISASAAATFDIDDTFIAPASVPYVIDTNDNRHDLTLIKPQEAESGVQTVYIAGQDPQTLYFTAEILTGDQLIGGTLFLPSYTMPDDINTASSSALIVVEDADWLVIATAAKIAFNDITYEDKVGDLNSEANALYSQMVKTNRRGVSGKPRRSMASVNRIGQRHR